MLKKPEKEKCSFVIKESGLSWIYLEAIHSIYPAVDQFSIKTDGTGCLAFVPREGC